MLDGRDRITARRDIETSSLDQAVLIAQRLLADDPLHSPAIDIWERGRKVERVVRESVP
jgi:hypothetical protein